MNGLQPTVQKITEDSGVDALGKVIRTTTVQYVVGDHGPFFVQLPSAQFSAGAARALMTAKAAEINALVGPSPAA
jgi:hypothetical protein